MSWDAHLVLDGERGQTADLGDWNYTHNTNGMIRLVLTACGIEYLTLRRATVGVRRADGTTEWRDDEPCGNWWDVLNGMDGEAGAAFLERVVKGLRSAPALFRLMNPENGWGDYRGLLDVLTEMRDRSAGWPAARWEVSG